MRFDILTLFPDMFSSPFSESIIRRGVDKGLVDINLHQIRDYCTDRHKTVDDTIYGGGAGMLMKPEPLAAAIRGVKKLNPDALVLLTTPQGRSFNQQMAVSLLDKPGLIILCGRYEGIDARIHQHYVDLEISVGDYVLSGGELAAMVVVDCVTRLIPGVLGSSDSATEDTFTDGLLEYPQYTRPPEFEGHHVPEVLLSGNHAEIARWRREQSLLKTAMQREELLENATLSKQDRQFLSRINVHNA